MPSADRQGGLFRTKKAIPRKYISESDSVDETVRGNIAAAANGSSSPAAQAQLATGNRNLGGIVEASAEEVSFVIDVSTTTSITFLFSLLIYL